MSQTALLTPALILVLWTFTIFLIFTYGRLNFIKNANVDAAQMKDLRGNYPAWVERASDNYNHLFEQPVAFYVVTLAIALTNNFDPLMIQLAWAFVILRIIHSLIQLTINYIPLRFCIFAAGWLIIAFMVLSQLF